MKAAASIDAYLAGVSDAQREAMQRIREQIHAHVPQATEAISYGVPTFKLNGTWMIAFGAWRTGWSLYTGGMALDVYKDELSGYRTSKGTINVPLDRPLPPDLLRRIVDVAVQRVRPT
jgi:uncharacterized protein YdhG (YjbR/CyaY superfamily)